MDVVKALAELREQRDNLNRAILSLERLARSRLGSRGRPLGPTAVRPTKRRVIPAHASEDPAKTALE